MSWDPPRIAELKKLWAAGLSASQIAGRFGDVTRNAVISKVHRLGLAGRTTTVRSPQGSASLPIAPTRITERRKEDAQIHRMRALAAQMRATDPAPLPVLPSTEREAPLSAASDGVSFLDLEDRHCRWPLSPACGIDTIFCGQPRERGSYCSTHYNLSRNKQPNQGHFAIRRRKAA